MRDAALQNQMLRRGVHVSPTYLIDIRLRYARASAGVRRANREAGRAHRREGMRGRLCSLQAPSASPRQASYVLGLSPGLDMGPAAALLLGGATVRPAELVVSRSPRQLHPLPTDGNDTVRAP